MRLSDTEKYSTVSIAPNRTLEERYAHKELVEDTKNRHQENSRRVFYIEEIGFVIKGKDWHSSLTNVIDSLKFE